MGGYIKLHRSLLNWEWWDDNNVLKLFIFCLLRANHKKESWHGTKIEPGQFVTSYEKLAKSTGLSVRQIRTAINKLKSTGELTSKTTSQNSIITVNNWDMFQQNDKQNDKQATSERQASDKRATTNNNDKNYKNDKKLLYSLSKNPDLMFNENVNKIFDMYEANCSELVPIKYERRDLELRQSIFDFLFLIDFNFDYFFDLCQKANKQRFLLDNKIDLKSLIKNHDRIYSGFFKAKKSEKKTISHDDEREKRLKELERNWGNAG